VASNDLTSKPKTKQTLKQDSVSVALLHKHNSVHQDDPMEATILNEQFQFALSRKSPNNLSCLCHMKLQISTDADSFMLDITVTSKGIEKLLSNLNPHNTAGTDRIKPIILKNISFPLSPILKHLFQKSLDSGTFPPSWKDANVVRVYKTSNALTLPTTGPYPLPVFFVKP